MIKQALIAALLRSRTLSPWRVASKPPPEPVGPRRRAWGIGYATAAKLAAVRITTAAGLRDLNPKRGALPTSHAVAGMKRLGHAGEMTSEPATHPGYRFPAEIISHAVWAC